MEQSYSDERKNTFSFLSKQPDPNEERGYASKLANVVYVFYSENEPGIKFYDRTPDESVQELIGKLPSNVFLTDVYSVEIDVVWDGKVNSPNESKVVLYSNGEPYVITTRMVTQRQFMEIQKKIQSADKEKPLKIDTRSDKEIFLEDIKKYENIDNMEKIDKTMHEDKENIDLSHYNDINEYRE